VAKVRKLEETVVGSAVKESGVKNKRANVKNRGRAAL
jgi:hypothetical protein